MLGLAAHHQDAQAEGSVLWLGPSDPPHSIAAALLARGVKLSADGPHDSPQGRLAALPRGAPSRASAPAQLGNRRVLLLHSDPERANLLGWALSARGALARTFERSALDTTAAFDADVVLVDQRELLHSSWDDVRAIWRHARLRWTPCLLVSWDELESGNEAELDTVCHAINQLSTDFDTNVALAKKEQPFQLSFRTLGPSRSLRAVLAQSGARELRFAAPRMTIEVHVAGGIILGARGRFTDGSSIELQGARALACLFGLESGTMQVAPQLYSALSNVMATFDEALVRGPDGATLSESVIALLPTLEQTEDECGCDDETLFLKRTPSVSGIRERVVQQTDEAILGADDVDDDDDEDCRTPTRKHRAPVLPAVPHKEEDLRPSTDHEIEQAQAPLISPPPLIADFVESEPARERLQLRCDELTDDRPSRIRRKSRTRGLFASVLAIGITLCGVLSVESDRAALEQLIVEGITLVHSLLESGS